MSTQKRFSGLMPVSCIRVIVDNFYLIVFDVDNTCHEKDP